MDRNKIRITPIDGISRSLSARRAWIEILVSLRQVCLICVALRKESVDRNKIRITPIDGISRSLSARRAWIEITVVGVLATLVTASLSARRAWIEITSNRRI